MLHIPLLRKGIPYRSLDTVTLRHHRGGEPFVEISQANAGLIRRDLANQEVMRAPLAALTTGELLGICRRAADHFANGALPIGDDEQSPQDYIEQVSATTGLPHALVRRNMEKIHSVLSEMSQVLRGLTRGLDVRVLDDGYSEVGGQALSFFPRGQSLGVVLPSNSPGVHSLWAPSIPLKMPLVLKPGSAEPWTPYRIAQALFRAGCPLEAIGYYPTDHAGGGEILRMSGRGLVFGDTGTTTAWRNDPRIEVHGPGYSKILIGDDVVHRWGDYLDVMVRSVVDNGGRSCVNASGIWVTRCGDEIADALARRLAEITPRDVDDPHAELAPFADAAVAQRISDSIDADLADGAADVTAAYRADRLVQHDGSTYLLPTIVRCDSADHKLANREFLFPFASVIEAPRSPATGS
jgi:hypothetical protein